MIAAENNADNHSQPTSLLTTRGNMKTRPLEEMGADIPIPAAYWERFASAFSAFQQITNEQTLVCQVIRKRILASQTTASLAEGALLDIGPGYGETVKELHLPFAQRVAVEPNPLFVCAVEPIYNHVIQAPWECVAAETSYFSVVIATQVLYYMPTERQVPCIHAMIDRLLPGGMLFLTLDTFDGDFGRFVLQWSERFGVSRHVVFPAVVRAALTSRADVDTNETTIVATLQADATRLFSEGVSVYFDVHPHSFAQIRADYRSALEHFSIGGGKYSTENTELLWTIRKRG